MIEKIHIFGPCAAESEEQVLRIAQAICRDAIHSVSPVTLIFRAGIWKPRTSPDTFQGVGDIGLTWLQRVKQELGIPVATEVSTPEQVRKALAAGIDYLWLGARTSANPILVQALADAITGNAPKGILIKNPVNEDADLWIGNIRRFSKYPVMAIHRGCGHKPCWEMAYRLRQELPNVPLILDPSHMSGDADKVPELCRIADELNYDGLMIEVHDDPQHALSDAKQQITPAQLSKCLNDQIVNDQIVNNLAWLRRIMDETDDEIWSVIARRMQVSRQIGDWKREHKVDIVQPARFDAILQRRLAWAKSHGLSEDTVKAIMNALHNESIQHQQ